MQKEIKAWIDGIVDCILSVDYRKEQEGICLDTGLMKSIEVREGIGELAEGVGAKLKEAHSFLPEYRKVHFWYRGVEFYRFVALEMWKEEWNAGTDRKPHGGGLVVETPVSAGDSGCLP